VPRSLPGDVTSLAPPVDPRVRAPLYQREAEVAAEAELEPEAAEGQGAPGSDDVEDAEIPVELPAGKNASPTIRKGGARPPRECRNRSQRLACSPAAIRAAVAVEAQAARIIPDSRVTAERDRPRFREPRGAPMVEVRILPQGYLSGHANDSQARGCFSSIR
jgi:hypothetical protein